MSSRTDLSHLSDLDAQAVTSEDRLRALAASQLLDSPPEAVFDRAVELATHVLGTPVGLLSLVDGHRQFFKAQTGLPEPYAAARETPLSHSFCKFVVGLDAPLVVRDARLDPLLKTSGAIPDLNVIAYLGVPVHGDRGHVLGSFCAIDTKPRDWTDHERQVLETIAVGVESEIALRAELKRRKEAERAIQQAEERLRLALRAGRLGTFDFDPRTGTANWDAAMYDLWWIERDEDHPFSVAGTRVHPDDRAADEAARKAALDPAGDGQQQIELRIVHPDSGDIRWLHIDGAVSFEADQPVRVVGMARDVTARRKVELQNALLAQELNHRVKNLFAITAGMIALTAKSSETPQAMAAVLRGRVHALATAHELIRPAIVGTPDAAEATTLDALVGAILSPHQGHDATLKITGPLTDLSPRAASSLALVLHELATNAVKYGALATECGLLSVSWDIDAPAAPSETLVLKWIETCPDERDTTPPIEGFGSTLIDVTVTSQMDGAWHRDWTPAGLSATLRIPMQNLRN
ncbi:GAF domain-containing protein [Maribius pontilimi]|uniref:histidine kinase n=1 Tax=Palleronia pontilimi TaxID=1964209 RepID=A0A934IFM8_9RHOB|nr:HWE histidine kinase domain-containing protein [Palleronia pontilimi]MBJ3762565.1 GAF domain-containing protein [Palleronia pontilimi]